MKSDIELFKIYNADLAYNNKAGNTFSWLQNTIANQAVEMIDVEATRLVLNDILDYLALKKKFIFLMTEAKGQLSYSVEGFKLYDKTYQTINEVEKALKNKAFL